MAIEGELNREAEGIYDRMNGTGAHEVIIDTPEHNQALEERPVADIALALTACQERMSDLQRDEGSATFWCSRTWGAKAGASLRHSHFQLIATPGPAQSLGSRSPERSRRGQAELLLRDTQRRFLAGARSRFVRVCGRTGRAYQP